MTVICQVINTAILNRTQTSSTDADNKIKGVFLWYFYFYLSVFSVYHVLGVRFR